MDRVPIVALDHVGLVASTGEHRLLRLLEDELQSERSMPSGVVVGRFGPALMLELVRPGQPGTPVDRFLERRGPGLHHIALQVGCPVTVALERLGELGFVAAGGIEPSSDGRASAFLHPSSVDGILVELVEGPRPRL